MGDGIKAFLLLPITYHLSLSKSWFSLLYESFVGFTVIRMLHAQALSLRFPFERCVEAHVHLAVEHLFRHRESERRATRQTFGECAHGVLQLFALDDVIIKADLFSFLSRNKISRVEQLRRLRQSDDARQ